MVRECFVDEEAESEERMQELGDERTALNQNIERSRVAWLLHALPGTGWQCQGLQGFPWQRFVMDWARKRSRRGGAK